MFSRTSIAPLLLALCVSPAIGCYSYTASTPKHGNDCPQEMRSETKFAYFWGIVPAAVDVDILTAVPGCPTGNPLSSVTVDTNPGYFFVTLLTLGTVAPMTVRWTCAKPHG